jgi:hypothetical protein
MTAVIFWDVAPCSCCKDRRLGGTYFLHHQGEKQIAVNFVPSSFILFKLMIETIRSPETSGLTTATRHRIPEEGILNVQLLLQDFPIFLRNKQLHFRAQQKLRLSHSQTSPMHKIMYVMLQIYISPCLDPPDGLFSSRFSDQTCQV